MTLYEIIKSAKSSDEKTQQVIDRLKEYHAKKFWFEFQETLEELVFKHRDFDSRDIIEGTFQELQTNLDSMVIMQLLDEYIERRQLSHDEAVDCIERIKVGFSKVANAVIFSRLLELKQKLKKDELESLSADMAVVEKEILQLRNCPKTIYSQLYKLKCDYLWRKKDYNSYFPTVLTYVAYTPRENFSTSAFISLAEKCVSAALTGDDLLNFNEVISSDLFKCLGAIEEKRYLCDIAALLNAGQIDELAQSVEANKAKIRGSILEPFLNKILKNVRVISLCDKVFLSSDKFTHQSISFNDIALSTKVSAAEVESLLIYVLSTEMMKGYIDQVKQVFHVDSIKPRALDTTRIEQLRQKFSSWNEKISSVFALTSSC